MKLWTVLLCLVGCARANLADVDASPTRDAPQSSGGDAHTSDSNAGGCAQAFTGVLATWDFSGESGSQTFTAVKTTAPGVTAGSAMRSSGLTAVSGLNSINASNWATASARDSAKYFALSVIAPAGCQLTVTSVAIDARASSSGPTMAQLSTSADTYAQTATVSTAVSSTPVLSATGGTVELRIYGYAASASTGTMRLQNTLAISGSVE